MRLVHGAGPVASDPATGALRRRVVLPLAVVAVLSVALGSVLALAATGRGPFGEAPGQAAGTAPTTAPSPGGDPSGPALPVRTDLAERFLAEYVDDDGRVVRRDQGGDTVSEGQAYAMLLAVADDDEESFDRVWTWTEDHLARPDGLLSWTWRDGEVVDRNSAADADVDAAHALAVAADHFDRPDLATDAEALAGAVLDHETRVTSLGRVLLAGQWATEEPFRVNPSYGSPAAYAVLGAATGDPRWAELAEGDRRVLERLLERSPLPPDWAQVHADGSVNAMPPPGGGAVDYGLDAQRITVRYAASCVPGDRELVERIGTSLKTVPDEVRGVYDLGGSPQVDWQHPVALVSAAAATRASGEPGATTTLLDAAADLDGRSTTYYGAAWAALGERFLEESVSLGIACDGKESR